MKKMRVVVVDDSAFSRRTITKLLEEMPGVEVVGFATNGEEGIQKVIALKPDLVTLDLEMPRMDGFTLLRILATRFSVPVIVISALSGADKVFKALELGAIDFVGKPSGLASTDLLLIKDDLYNKVVQVANIKPKISTPLKHEEIDSKPLFENKDSGGIKDNKTVIDLVAIGSSTGGPPALQTIFNSFEEQYPFAIVVSQHMPAGFTKAFAERLNRTSNFEVKEAQDGDPVLPGHILIAPGGMNMVFEVCGGRVVARVVPPSQSDRYIPSVDVMFESCAGIYKKRMIAVVLTGMGNDGSKGIRTVSENGGYIISESEDSSVVYGMPREAAATGLVDKVLPLSRVSREILIKGELI